MDCSSLGLNRFQVRKNPNLCYFLLKANPNPKGFLQEAQIYHPLSTLSMSLPNLFHLHRRLLLHSHKSQQFYQCSSLNLFFFSKLFCSYSPQKCLIFLFLSSVLNFNSQRTLEQKNRFNFFMYSMFQLWFNLEFDGLF